MLVQFASLSFSAELLDTPGLSLHFPFCIKNARSGSDLLSTLSSGREAKVAQHGLSLVLSLLVLYIVITATQACRTDTPLEPLLFGQSSCGCSVLSIY